MFGQLGLLHDKYRTRTMCSREVFIANLELVSILLRDDIPGVVVECGTWRGGMIAAMAEVLGDERQYVLCDSFQGLPPAREIDGPDALSWQQSDDHDNCRASQEEVNASMRMSGISSYRVVPGWFKDTLPKLEVDKIAILRLDADWHKSTMDCLFWLWDKVVPGGVIIVDDYYVWDGCSRAVHEFLTDNDCIERIRSHGDVAYMVKR